MKKKVGEKLAPVILETLDPKPIGLSAEEVLTIPMTFEQTGPGIPTPEHETR